MGATAGLSSSAGNTVGQANRGTLHLRPLGALAVLAAAWFLLADCQQNFFHYIEQTGGQAMMRIARPLSTETGRLDYVLRHRLAGKTWIVADDWWSYWPLRYLACAEKELHVIGNDDLTSHNLRASAEGRGWIVAFSDGKVLPLWRAALAEAGCKVQEERILDYAGRPVLVLLHPLADARH